MASKVIGTAPELNDLIPGIKDFEGEYHHSAWSSTESFARYVEDMDEYDAWHNSAWQRSDGEWNGTSTMEEALDLAQRGWKEGIERIEKALKYVRALNPILKEPKRYGIAGTTPNIPRAIAGNPLNMRIPTEVKTKRHPVITVITYMSVSWNVSSEAIVNRAAVTAAMIDHIEAQGFSCEVISMCQSKGYKDDFKAFTSVVVKKSNQPVDLVRLSFALGHTAMFRRLVFADWGGSPDCQPLGHSLGYIQHEMLPSQEQNEKGIFVLPSMQNCSDKFKDEDKAAREGVKWLTDQFRLQGCPAFPKLSAEERKAMEETEEIEPDYDDDDDDF